MPDYESDVRKKLAGQLEKLNQAYAGLKASFVRLDPNRELIPYITPMNNIMNRLQQLSDSQYNLEGGIQKPLTPESYAELSDAYRQALDACSRYMVNVEENPRGKTALELRPMAGEVTEAVKEIAETLARDMRALDQYKNHKEAVSFQELIAETAPLTLDIGKENLGTVGAALSSRIPFDYTMPNGEHVNGVFTPKKVYDAGGDTAKLINDAEKNMTGFKDFMEVYLDAYKAARKLDPNKTTEHTLLQFGGYSSYVVETDKDGNRRRRPKTGEEFINTVKKLATQLSDAGNEKGQELLDAWTQVGQADNEDIEKFTGENTKLLNAIDINVNASQISDKSRIDSRNSAMSAVADMLGVPNIVAKSTPMTVQYQDKKIEGTFMEKATGMDYEHPTQDALQYNKNTFQSNGLKSVSDLQVLDLLCGNTDRHMANLVYQFDTTGEPGQHKLTGVQGIDNDSSFGMVTAEAGSPSGKFTRLDCLNVISASMARRVERLNRDEFKMKLRGFDLSEEQLEAAAKRLDALKDKIAEGRSFYGNANNLKQLKEQGKVVDKGQLRVIPDDRFEKLDLDKIKGGNFLFTHLSAFDQRMKNKVADGKQLETKQVNQQLGYVINSGEGNRMTKNLADMKAATGIRGTSKEFENLRTAVQKYEQFCLDHKGEALSPAEYELRSGFLRGIRNASVEYLKHKGLVNENGKANPSAVNKMNSYEKKRVQLVLDISADAVNRIENTDANFYKKLFVPGKNATPEQKQKMEKDRGLLRESNERADKKLNTKKLGEDKSRNVKTK